MFFKRNRGKQKEREIEKRDKREREKERERERKERDRQRRDQLKEGGLPLVPAPIVLPDVELLLLSCQQAPDKQEKIERKIEVSIRVKDNA